jgi:hypothetical protein
MCTNGGFDCEECEIDVVCPGNQKYQLNSTQCGTTCSTYDRRDECPDETYPGCGCPDQHLLNMEVKNLHGYMAINIYLSDIKLVLL